MIALVTGIVVVVILGLVWLVGSLLVGAWRRTLTDEAGNADETRYEIDLSGVIPRIGAAAKASVAQLPLSTWKAGIGTAVAIAAFSTLAATSEARGACTKDNWVAEEAICTPEGKVELWQGGVADPKVSVSFKECGPATLELGKKTYRTEDTCDQKWGEPRHDGLLFFFQEPKWFDDHYIVSISISDDESNLERQIPMRIHYGGRMIRRWLYAVVSRHGAKKIWEGTDAFVNVCIDRGLEIRSSGGVLYCETGGWVYRELSLERMRSRI